MTLSITPFNISTLPYFHIYTFNMKNPLFSCVIPVKGPRPFFDEALASLCMQGMDDNLEIIVQDADVEPDKGQSDALNKGFAKATGEWLFWLNADDVLLPGALEKVRKFLTQRGREAKQRKDVEWIAGNMVTIDEKGRVLRCFKDRGSKAEYAGRPIRVFGPSSFFRRELFERVGGFDVSLRYCMDTDLWCRFREADFWFEKLDGYIWGFREHSDSTTAGVKTCEEQARQDAEVEAMHKRRGVVLSSQDVRDLRLRRILDGTYLKTLFDTAVLRGKDWRELS